MGEEEETPTAWGGGRGGGGDPSLGRRKGPRKEFQPRGPAHSLVPPLGVASGPSSELSRATMACSRCCSPAGGRGGSDALGGVCRGPGRGQSRNSRGRRARSSASVSLSVDMGQCHPPGRAGDQRG